MPSLYSQSPDAKMPFVAFAISGLQNAVVAFAVSGLQDALVALAVSELAGSITRDVVRGAFIDVRPSKTDGADVRIEDRRPDQRGQRRHARGQKQRGTDWRRIVPRNVNALRRGRAAAVVTSAARTRRCSKHALKMAHVGMR